MSLDEFTAAARAFLDANAERREAEKTVDAGFRQHEIIARSKC